MKPGDVAEEAWLRIESIDMEAQGVARRDDGKVVFVAGALPGEEVTVDIRRRKNQWEQGSLRALRRESVLRVRPRCPHFGLHAGACGGCKMQHLESGAQIAVKQRALEDQFRHLAKLKPEKILRPLAGPTWGYRSRARFAVRYVARKGCVLVGFHERASRYVADMRTCPVLPPEVDRLLLPLRELIGAMDARERLPQIEVAAGDGVVAFALRHLEPLGHADLDRLRRFALDFNVQWWLQPGGPQTVRRLEGGDCPELGYDLPEFGLRMPFAPTDFTQVNLHVNRTLVGLAIRLLDLRGGPRAIDWFCGLGNFTLPMAVAGAEVLGIEGSQVLVARAQNTASRHGLHTRARFEMRNLFELSAADLRAIGTVDRWLIDPPREGAFALAKALADLQAAPEPGWEPPARIVYVSCNPATLARDAGLLVHQAGYRCIAAGVVNMFPHTAHVESMAVFQRND